MTPKQILYKADMMRLSGMSNEGLIVNMASDVMDTIEEVRISNPEISGEDVAMKIIHDMFEKYK